MPRIAQSRLITAASAVIALACAAPSYAQQARGGEGVAYVSGGVGIDSQDRLNSQAREYNLKLVFTLNEGNYLAGVNVVVTDGRAKVIDAVSDGPFFLAKLPAGTYTVTATHEGKSQTRKVSVGKGLQTAHLRWSASAGDTPLPRDQTEPRSIARSPQN